jgi:hypothetical protein
MCGEPHWDVYGKLCEVCLALLSIKEPIGLRFDYTNPCDNNEPVWKSVLRELVWYFHSASVHIDDVFLEVAETLKRIKKAHAATDEECPF